MRSKRRLRICHVTTSLTVGGAQKMLAKLLKEFDPDLFESHVITLIDGPVRSEIEVSGSLVTLLWGRKKQAYNPLGLFKLAGLLNKIKPDVIQGWMYHGNLAAQLAAGCMSNPSPVLWNVRGSVDNIRHEKLLTRLVLCAGAWLPKAPARVIYNSHLSAVQHERFGYPKDRRLIIPNGFDCERFQPNYEMYKEVRQEMGGNSDMLLVGHVARYHPMKDHENLLQAASIVINRLPDVHFVLVGNKVDRFNSSLKRLIQRLNIESHVHLLGLRTDLPRLTASFDLSCLSSAWGEAFPNVVGEAMASGVPCVVTDSGDCTQIVGDTGAVVPPQAPEALAKALIKFLSMAPPERVALGRKARQRIIENYSIEAITKRYETLYQSVCEMY